MYKRQVNDLVFSTNSNYHDIALNQLRGGFSKKLNIYRTELINLTALLELEIDFAEEDVEFASRDKLKSTITCLLYTSDAADDLLCVDLGACLIIKKKKNTLIRHF